MEPNFHTKSEYNHIVINNEDLQAKNHALKFAQITCIYLLSIIKKNKRVGIPSPGVNQAYLDP